MTKILLVEDDGKIAAYLGELLRAEVLIRKLQALKKRRANAFWYKLLIWCSLM